MIDDPPVSITLRRILIMLTDVEGTPCRISGKMIIELKSAW